eukprot:gene11274-12282_t
MMIVDRKTIHQLGGKMVESNANKPSAYAMKLMEKMGWKEGQGLGRNEDGIVKHVAIQKREENIGLGHDKLITTTETMNDNWWGKSFAQTLATFTANISTSSDSEDEAKKKKQKKKEKKEKKEKRESDEAVDVTSSGPVDTSPSLEELFLLTGGKMFGMRARREQKGKIRRTESDNRLLTLLEEKKSAVQDSDDSSSENEEIERETKKEEKKSKKKEKKRKHDEVSVEKEEEEEKESKKNKNKKRKKEREEN